MGKSEPAAHFDFVNGCAGFFCSKIWRPDTSRTPCNLNYFSVSHPPGPYKRDTILFLDCFSCVPFYSPPVLSTVASRLKHMQRINISKTLTIA